MNKKNYAILSICLVLLALGFVWFNMGKITNFHDEKNTQVSAKDIIKDFSYMPSARLNVKVGTQNSVCAPSIIASNTGKFQLVQDDSFGVFQNIRQETVFKIESGNVKNKTAFIINTEDGSSIKIDRLPDIITSSIYYAPLSGAIPLNSIFTWDSNISVESWEKTFKDAGFQSNKRNMAGTPVLVLTKGNNTMVEVSTNRQNKNTVAVLYIQSQSEKTVRDYADSVLKTLSLHMASLKPVQKSGFLWRCASPVLDYSVADHKNLIGVDVYAFNDRNFIDGKTPVINHTHQSWNNYPIAASWIMDGQYWDQIKENFVKENFGRDATDNDLINGIESEEKINLKVVKYRGNNNFVEITITDKEIDTLLAFVFEKFNSSIIKTIRNNNI